MNRKSRRRLSRSQRRYANRHNNRKPVEAYFPLTCGKCGFTARGPNELIDHEHDSSEFDRE